MTTRSQDPGRKAPLQGALRAVLDALARTRGTAAGPSPALREAVKELEAALAAAPPLKKAGLATSSGLGTGRLAPTPWAGALRGDAGLEGAFPVFRFRRDGSGVYLGLGQDFTAAEKLLGHRDGLAYLRQRALSCRRSLMTLATRDFVLDDRMDLRAGTGRSADHPAVTVAYRFFPADALPAEADLLRDLEILVATCVELGERKARPRRTEPATWIFGASAAQLDLTGAVRQLERLHFDGAGPAADVQAGDRAWLAELGEEPGILALATVLNDPDELPLPEAEKKFLRRPDPAGGQGAPRVALRIDRVLPERVTRAALGEQPILASIPLGRPGAPPVLALTPDTAAALAALVQAAGMARFSYAPAVEALAADLAGRSFVFEPWQVAAYAAALRTKPFVILAGVSGTGKSKLPRLVADATGGTAQLLPVRPDWTDSSDLLGYVDLQGRFRPGLLLELAKEAMRHPAQHYVAIVDEMNLARVEHYFAEVLSRIEDRRPGEHGGFDSGPLLGQKLGEGEGPWRNVVLPANLALVGTVNMDESAHGFSRKVLDRAFTLELSDVDLARWEEGGGGGRSARWPIEAWYPRAIQLGGLGALEPGEAAMVERVIEVLGQVNRFLVPAQLQVGYRVRDEMALFLLHAREHESAFVTSRGEPVDPLDLALQMKVLPRLVGGSATIRKLLLGLLGWSMGDEALKDEEQAGALVEGWEASGRPSALPAARFPRTAARLALMWDRLQSEGFTSYWL